MDVLQRVRWRFSLEAILRHPGRMSQLVRDVQCRWLLLRAPKQHELQMARRLHFVVHKIWKQPPKHHVHSLQRLASALTATLSTATVSTATITAATLAAATLAAAVSRAGRM